MNTRIIIFLILLVLIGCTSNDTTTNDEVIARVSGKSLTIGEAKQMIPHFILEQDSIYAIQSYATKWVQEQVTLEHARRIGIQNTDQYFDKIKSYEEQVLNTLLRDHILESNREQIEISHDEALAYYQSYRSQLTFNETFVRFRIISTQSRTDAESANIDLMNGIEWEEILNRYSINPELQLRQSTQFWPISLAASDLPSINQNLRTLGLSERSSIHYDGNYYHLVQLMEERTVEEYPDLDWLIPQISEWLKLEKSRRITNAYLRNLYLQADSNNEIELRNVSEIEQILTN